MNKKIIRIRDKVAARNRDVHHITDFFLMLFKHRLKALNLAPAKYERAEENCFGTSYALSVMHQGGWTSRKMTVGPIGAPGTSKSRCYRAIYDDHMVVKFPPEIIDSFDDYLAVLKKEEIVASVLAPVDCVIPKVSVVLKHVISPEELPGFIEKTDLDDDAIEVLLERHIIKKKPGLYQTFIPITKELSAADISYLLTKTSLSKQQVMSLAEAYEKQFIYLLQSKPEYQEYLKINGRFVFFSSLSDHGFVNDAIKKLHDIGPSIEKEIAQSGNRLWEQGEFVDNYAPRYAHYRDRVSPAEAEISGLQKRVLDLYEAFEAGVNAAAAASGVRKVETHRLHDWFLLLLAGKKNQRYEKDLPAELSNMIAELMSDLEHGRADDRVHAETITAYRKFITAHVAKINFKKNTKHFSGIIANCMHLLVLLQDKIAHRDIKPANLIIVGNHQRFPSFLADPDLFEIGMIDFETSCDIRRGTGQPDQPMMSGTLRYTTVSSFYNNKVLLALHNDLRRLFHAQDYFGMMALIFEVATGANLFNVTKRVVSSTYRDIVNIYRHEPDEEKCNLKLRASYIRHAELFWKVAEAEFKKQMLEKESILAQLPLDLSGSVTDALMRELAIIKKHKKMALGSCFDKFSKQSRDFVRRALTTTIEKYIEKLQHQQSDPDSVLKLGLLTEIKQLKLQLREIVSYETLLAQKGPDNITVYDLLRIMYNIVSFNLARPGEKNAQDSDNGPTPDGSSMDSTAIMIL